MVGTVPSRSRRSHGRDSGDHCAHSHDWLHMHHSDVIGGLMVEYDVLGNERHKAICKLSEMPKLYPNKDGGADLYAWKSALADAIGADTELFSAIRDRLIHLLGGDQPKLSELFGILREDDDGVDARPSDTASADSPVHGSAGCGCGSRCGELDEEVAPITTELRNYLSEVDENLHENWLFVNVEWSEVNRLCDNIDAVHAGLERDYAMACRVNEQQDHEYIDLAKRYDKTITLPLDADGLPIRIGDVMDFTKNVCNLTVLGIGIVDETESSLGVFVREGHDYVWYNAEFLHHHVPTVEGLIRDAIGRCIGHLPEYWDEPIAECAAKLKLADA